MSGVTGVTSAARVALSTAITAGGLTCRAYDSWDIDAGNIATLGLARWNLPDDPDQAIGFRTITIPVLIYQIIDGSINDSLGYQESNVEDVVNGLGRDRTLGGKVANSSIVSDATTDYYRLPNGTAYSVVSFDVVVMPFANTGAV